MSASAEDPAASDATVNLARVAGRDPTALATLYERVAPAVFAWARLRLRPSLRHLVDPEDVMQEVWYRACKRLDSYDPDRTPFRGWIFRIADLVVMEAFRGLRGRPLPGDHEGGAPPPPDALSAKVTTVSRRVASDDSLRAVIARLQRLPQDEQRLLLYRGLEGAPHDEVARRLNITSDAARKKWERLREKLQALDLPNSLLEGR
jgi:RNA polymerase sigma factor (sigma-70 family)